MMAKINAARWQKLFREFVGLAILVSGILAARSTLADHYHVPSGSMEYSLMIGDRVVVDKRAYGFRLPFTNVKITAGDRVARGDIVIFDSPLDGKRLIKRIVAVGGDEVLIRNGSLFVNGVPRAAAGDLALERIGAKSVALNLNDGGGPDWAGRLADGEVLAIGDHRGNSVDGRIFGAVPEKEIYGRALAVYYRRGAGFGWHAL